VKPHGWRDLDPAVIAELRKLAAIRENPYALLHAQYVSLRNQYALSSAQEDDLPVPMFPPITEAEQFDSNIMSAIWVAHLSIALSSPKKLTTRKKIARCARELAKTLRHSAETIKRYCSTFFRIGAKQHLTTLLQQLANWQTKRVISAVRREVDQAG
jgi:hypothetical protein